MKPERGRKPQDADYGLGEHSIDCDQLGLIDEAELTERLVRTFSDPGYVPPRLPAVATELLSLSQRPDVEFEAVEALLEQDALLAGEVLSVARSAFYAGTRQVSTLREALVRIGLTKLRDVVMQVAMNMRVFRSEIYAGSMERLRRHSQSVAHLSGIVSRYTSMGEDQAFLCGLLHDVGFAGTLLVLGDVGRGKKAPDLAMLWPAIDAAHARAGEQMVRHWGLPPEIAMVVAAHHEVRIEGFDHPLAATVCVAEALSVELETAFDETDLTLHGPIDRSDGAIVDRAREALRLTDKMADLIRADARKWTRDETAAAT